MPEPRLKYCLDTNAVSDYLRGVDSVVRQIQNAKPSALAISAVTVMELRYGETKRQSPRLTAAVNHFLSGITVIPFDTETAAKAGILCAEMKARGITIALADCQIAATALNLKLTMISNDADIKRVPKLRVLDWRAVK